MFCKKWLLLGASTLLFTTTYSAAESLEDAVKNGNTKIDLRFRYEHVDQDAPIDKDANAITLRSRISYSTAAYKGFTAFGELDNVTAFDSNEYNSTVNGNTIKATVADPDGTELNQAWLSYTLNETQIKYGRQRINLDNQRFVGGVGFRQNEQTYDALSISNTKIADTKFFYARVNNVNRIFGEDSLAGDHDSRTDLVNINYSGLQFANITAYAYLIENNSFARFSTDTYGIRLNGKVKGDDVTVGYTLEFASQEDADNNSTSYNADYLLAETSVSISNITAKLGYEVLGSDDGDAAFITPLATLHKFQGWTDQFLATPAEGIEDLYLSIGGKISGVKLLAVYHEFTADENHSNGTNDLGDEWGLLAAKKFGPYGLSVKYANYSAGNSVFGKSNTEKLWLTATVVF